MTINEPKNSGLKEILVRLLLSFSILFFGTIFLVSEPLGDAAERYLVQILSPALSNIAYHGEPFDLVQEGLFSERDTTSYHNVVNVVVDDTSLTQEDASFPLAYWQYASHLELLGQQKPKAIFVDIWLHDKRANDNSMPDLVRVICSLANPPREAGRSPIKIYMLSLRAYGQTLHPELQKISDRSVEPGGQPCFTEVGADVPEKEPEQRGWYYPFNSCGEQCIPSAAVAIYNDLLALKPSDKISNVESGSFQLIWGNKAPSQNAMNDFYRQIYDNNIDINNQCVESKSSFYFLNYFLFSSLVSNPPVCGFFTEFNTFELKQARLSQHRQNAGAFMRKQLKDSVVVYGYKLTGLNDFIQSPIHGLTLGLNFHAMGIHNLDRMGQGVIRESNYESFVEDLCSLEVLYFAFLSALGACVVVWRQCNPPGDVNYSCALFQGVEYLLRAIKFSLYWISILLILFSIFYLNSRFFKLDYTVIIEGVFFLLALSSLGYVNTICNWSIKMLGLKTSVRR